ncbi:MAG: hypothetical protein GY883_20425 [Shimia sp.]|nr:hypothetical protein [Shimia sp.]
MDFTNLFPASSNAAYDGSILSAWYLGLMAVLTIVPGCIHYFLRDGGAQSIAGLRLERHQRLVFHLFAWAGATQIVWGLLMAAVVWRYQTMVPLVLALLVAERSLHLWNMWIGSKSGGYRPPEAYVTLALVPANLLFLLLSL